jgi:hypothetical protein
VGLWLAAAAAAALLRALAAHPRLRELRLNGTDLSEDVDAPALDVEGAAAAAAAALAGGARSSLRMRCPRSPHPLRAQRAPGRWRPTPADSWTSATNELDIVTVDDELMPSLVVCAQTAAACGSWPAVDAWQPSRRWEGLVRWRSWRARAVAADAVAAALAQQ